MRQGVDVESTEDVWADCFFPNPNAGGGSVVSLKGHPVVVPIRAFIAENADPSVVEELTRKFRGACGFAFD